MRHFFRPLNSGAKFPRFTRVVQKPRSREGLGLVFYSRAYSSALYPFYSVSGRTNGAGLRPFNFAETKKNCEGRKTAFYAYFIREGGGEKTRFLSCSLKQRDSILSFFLSFTSLATPHME